MKIKVDEVGIMVKDLDKAVELLTKLGIGPWTRLSDRAKTEKFYRGKPANYKLKIAIAWIGDVEIELLQHIEGECIQKEILERQGEGIYHIGYFVDDIDKEVADLKAMGLEPVQWGRMMEGGFCYFNTGVGNILIEPIKRPKSPDYYQADPESYTKEAKKK